MPALPLVADLVPVRVVISGMAGLYDEARVRFLSAETGTNLKPLVAGPDVPKRGLIIFFQ